MRILNRNDIMETIGMLTDENLDVRTVTMGISLLDCIDPDGEKACEKIYNKITRLAGSLVSTVDSISSEYGIPIVNKRISVTPIAMLLGAAPDADPVMYAKALDRAAKAVGVNFIGGFGALVHKGFSAGDRRLIQAIPRALAETDIVCSSVNIGSTKSGINMDAVKLMGEVVRETAELTKDNMCMGDAKLVVFCNAPEDNTLYGGCLPRRRRAGLRIHVGVSGPGAVRAALAKLPKDAPMDEVAELVKRTAFKITRLGQLVANLASDRLGVPAGIIDLSLAPPRPSVTALRIFWKKSGWRSCGCCGTTACLALLNDAVKKGGVMASNHVGGLSGAFIPVSEDDGMINAANCGSLTLEKLEAMTAVCSVGIDMVVIPGDTTAEVISGLIADEAAIGMVNSKTTAVRVIPAIGHKAGDVLDFGGLLGHAPIMPISKFSPAVMIHRGGRIPAPMQALKN
ncbi:MAG: PFL family protein [Subdoligranulum sp.]|nr:PFL family protein [Subdoligranulum sp.]